MGAPNIALKKYFSDKNRLIDVFNYFCFDGREELQAEDIEIKDSVGNILITGKENKKYPVERIRDVLAAAQKDGTILLLLGIENQSAIHYGMPVRHMLYDALTYANQIEDRAKKNRKENNNKINGAEFLSGLRKEEKLMPIITLVIYYGKEPWDGPRNLADMLDMKQIPSNLKPYIQSQYTLNLLEVREIRDYEKFHSDIKQVFQLLSCDDNKERMRQIIDQDEQYRHLSYDAVNAIAVLTSSNEIMNYTNGRESEINMCKAIQDMILDGEMRGEERGIRAGIQIFVQDNLEENIPRERIRQKLQRRFDLSFELAEQYISQYVNE